MVSLDKIDYKILQELDFNAKIPYTQLGKKIKLNKKTTEYRVRRLEKLGIIRGYYPLIDVSKLNVLYCRFFMTLQNVSKEEKEKLIEYILKKENSFWVFSFQGKYDLGGGFLCKSLIEFKNTVTDIKNNFGQFIKHSEENFATTLNSLGYSFLEELEKKEIVSEYNLINSYVDKLDFNILQKLTENARNSLVNLGIDLKISSKVVAYRIKQLENKGIIVAYRTFFDYDKLGLAYYKILFNLNKKDKISFDKLKKYLKSQKIVIYIVEGVSFSYDVDIEVLVDSNKELYDFIEKLRFEFPKLIDDFDIVMFGKTLKVDFVPKTIMK